MKRLNGKQILAWAARRKLALDRSVILTVVTDQAWRSRSRRKLRELLASCRQKPSGVLGFDVMHTGFFFEVGYPVKLDVDPKSKRAIFQLHLNVSSF